GRERCRISSMDLAPRPPDVQRTPCAAVRVWPAWIAVLIALALVDACAPKTVPLPALSTPRFPDFMTPSVPAAFANTPATINEDRGWRFLQAGDLKNAEREFQAALIGVPSFYPADASLGYVELAQKNANAALAHFDRVL